MPYKFNAVFNAKKLFSITPCQESDFSNLACLEEGWIQKLEKICCEFDSQLQKPFIKHIGEGSVYRFKETLTKQLAIIYRRLSGDFDAVLGPLRRDNRQALLCKLVEEVSLCTPGFHNRVNYLVGSFQKPNSLKELVYKVLKSLIEIVAHTLSNQVHTWNQVGIIANKQGLTAKANFLEDSYSGILSDVTISKALSEKLELEFQPFYLPFLLSEELRGCLSDVYIGFKQDGYSIGIAGDIGDKIKSYFSKGVKQRMIACKPFEDLFIVDKDDDLYHVYIHDLDWKRITRYFFETLIEENYFTSKPSKQDITTLLGCACYSELFCDSNLLGIEDKFITGIFDENNRQLPIIKLSFPNYWKKLTSYQPLIDRILSFENDIDKMAFNAKRFNQLIELLLEFELSVDSSLIVQFIDLLMLAVQRQQVAAIKRLFDFIVKQLNSQDQKALWQMLSKETYLHLLLLIIQHRAYPMKVYLDFISQQMKGLDLNEQRILVHQMCLTKMNTQNILMLAIRAEAFEPLLAFLSEFIKQCDQNEQKAFLQMFLEKDSSGLDLLRLALHFYPGALKALLSCISEQIKQCDRDTQEIFLQMFLEKDKYARNIVVLAADYHPKVIDSLLAFISQHREQIGFSALLQLCLDKKLNISLQLAIAKIGLEEYLNELTRREKNNITHTTYFFNMRLGYSTEEKRIAAEKLTHALQDNPRRRLLGLERSYPALKNARLGRLFQIFSKGDGDSFWYGVNRP